MINRQLNTGCSDISPDFYFGEALNTLRKTDFLTVKKQNDNPDAVLV